LKRLVAHKGVIGTVIVNSDGIPIKVCESSVAKV
jgi:hypothetical protein